MLIKIFENFVRWLFALKRWKKRSLQISFDVLIVPSTLIMAMVVRLETTSFLYKADIFIGAFIVTVCAVTTFAFRGLYKTFMRYSPFDAALTIVFGAFSSSAALFSGILLFGELKCPVRCRRNLCGIFVC